MAPRVVKALSVQQPWASQIAQGKKWVEFRPRRTKHRGELVICSSKRPTGEGPVGVALCVVDVVDCLELPDGFGWCLDSLRRFGRPFPVKGRLGLFPVQLPPGTRLARAVRRPENWRAVLDDGDPDNPDDDPGGPVKTFTFNG